MLLINSLLSHATDSHWEEFTSELERFNVRKAVVVGTFFSQYQGHNVLTALSLLPASYVLSCH